MLDPIAIGLVINLAATLVIAIVVLAIAREFGVVLVRLGPDRPLVNAEGLNLGEVIEPIPLVTVSGLSWGIGPTKGLRHLLVFAAPGCPLCEELLPGIRSLASAYNDVMRVTVVLRDAPKTARSMWHQLDGGTPGVVVAPTLFTRMNVLGTPFAMLLDADNKVAARGTPNTLEQLESLVSLQYYVHAGTQHSLLTRIEERSSSKGERNNVSQEVLS